MRRWMLAALTALVLAGCQSMYDDQAMDDCDKASNSGAERSTCYDRVQQNSREHRGH